MPISAITSGSASSPTVRCWIRSVLAISHQPSAMTDLFQQGAGGSPRLERDAHDAAARRLDNVASDDRVGRPVCALDEDIGPKRRDQIVWRALVEDDHRVHAGERREDLDPLLLR